MSKRAVTPSTHSLPGALQDAERGKIVSAAEAVRLIRDGDTVATGGFVGIGFAEEIAIALEERISSGDANAAGRASPRNLTLVYAAGQGDGKNRGLNHLGHEGLVRRVIGGHWGLVPQAAAAGGREPDRGLQPAAGRHHPPVSRHRRRQARAPLPVGLGTFVDPRHGGGKINARTTEDLVELMHDRRRGVPVLQGVPDRRRHHPRHHRRSRRQHHHGAGGADARGAGHRHGGAQLRRHRHRRRSSASPSAAPSIRGR